MRKTNHSCVKVPLLNQLIYQRHTQKTEKINPTKCNWTDSTTVGTMCQSVFVYMCVCVFMCVHVCLNAILPRIAVPVLLYETRLTTH